MARRSRRDVAVVAFAQSRYVRSDTDRNDVEILMPVIAEAIERSGIPRKEIGFTVSGSCDYLAGQPFAFVNALDAVGAWPPIRESHVEMDGAWALYEAWVRLQCGDVDSALVYAFGKSSLGDIRDVMTLQLDPYCVAPLWPDSISVAALQARAMLDAGRCTERDMAQVAARSRRDAMTGKPARQLRTPWTDAWDSPESPGALPMPLQFMASAEAYSRIYRAAEADPNSNAAQLAGTPIGQIAGMLHSVRPARDVIFDMVQEYVAAVDRLDALGMRTA